jgi:hypothetical protein
MTEQPATEPDAPAPAVPPATVRARLAWYAGSMALSLVLLASAYQFWKRDLRAPFYYDLDAMLYIPLVRSTVERGTHWENPRLGAPGQQELYDFPIIDFVHFKFLWLIGRFTSDVLYVYHIYSALTYPLTVLAAMWVLRWLGLSLPAAAVGAMLYAFTPFHQERYHYHYFLAAYWWVPVSMVPALALCRGALPFFAPRGDGTRRWNLLSWGAVGWCALGAVTAGAGAYYAFFACALTAFAGAYGWAVHKTWRAAASAVLLLAPVVVTGLLLHLPTYTYQVRHGVNPLTQRYPEEADNYGLKVAHMLLPTTDHAIGEFAKQRSNYCTPHRQAEGERAASLGTIGGIGLVGLIALALLPGAKRWPVNALVALTVYLVLLGSIGAFGPLFNQLVTPQIRAYNRISVFIAFLCLAAAVHCADRFFAARTGLLARQLRVPAFALLLAVGFFDQLAWGLNPFNWNGRPALDKFAERYRADRAFFAKADDVLPAGTMVFCLPYIGFPESPMPHDMPSTYEHARGAVMTNGLRFSYGAVKGREVDVWQRDVTEALAAAPELVLERIVARGFDGLFIDGRGFPPGRNPDKVAELRDRLNRRYQAEVGNAQVSLPVIVHDDGRQFVLDLRPFREAWRTKHPAEYAAREQFEREWVAALWIDGFFTQEPLEPGGERLHWGRFDCTLTFVNPTDRTRTFDLSFHTGVTTLGPFEVQLSGRVSDSYVLDKDESGDPKKALTLKSYKRIELPPGHSTIRFRCRPPSYFLPSDKKNLCYLIKDVRLTETK